MKKSYGFTLAEVLIVLTIIGVVAVLALPPIFSSVQEDRMKASATKALATISNAISLRNTMTNITPDMFAGACTTICPADGALAGYFTTTTTTNDKPAFIGDDNPAWSKPALKTRDACSNDGSNIICQLADNMTVSFPATNITGCIATTNGCMITVDTNGSSGPTRTPNGKAPTGSSGWTTTCTDNQMTNGNINIPTRNTCPDVIQLSIIGPKVIPANQRTRNILATGNAKNSQ